jgi:hypothetical protein
MIPNKVATAILAVYWICFPHWIIEHLLYVRLGSGTKENLWPQRAHRKDRCINREWCLVREVGVRMAHPVPYPTCPLTLESVGCPLWIHKLSSGHQSQKSLQIPVGQKIATLIRGLLERMVVPTPGTLRAQLWADYSHRNRSFPVLRA